jgi:S1-C subfamily serine protease
MRKTILILTCFILFSGCASVFIPKKERITINTGQEKAIVYVQRLEFGKGSFVSGKVNKKENNALQVVVQTEGYKEEHYALIKTHRPIAFWLLQILNLPFIIYLGGGNTIDFATDKLKSFNKVNECPVIYKVETRNETEKYIDFTNIKVSIKDKNKDFSKISVKYVVGKVDNQISIAEKDAVINNKLAEKNALMNKKNEKKRYLEEMYEKGIKYDDVTYSNKIHETLRKTGYIDTINKVFTDNINTLVLEGNIKKIIVYEISKKSSFGTYYKSKLYTTWYIKNSYSEILDSIVSQDYSGEFLSSEETYGDAVEVSYLKLHKDPKFTKYLKQESDFAIKDPLLNLQKPINAVLEKTDASAAAVIIKRKGGGHGSGFAITNDGYIITNYHVIANKFGGKPAEVTVITNEGQELEATIIRINKFSDLALLKVNKSFEKAFTVSGVKAFKNMQDVYTIGAPKSLELGQSISAGVISNERKSNNNNLLQLGMSVNGGNSGGPLYDEMGTLHGVIVSKLIGQNTEGVSFAIPGYLIEEYLNLKIN